MASAIASATDLDELKGFAVELLELYYRQRETVGQVVHGKIA